MGEKSVEEESPGEGPRVKNMGDMYMGDEAMPEKVCG